MNSPRTASRPAPRGLSTGRAALMDAMPAASTPTVPRLPGLEWPLPGAAPVPQPITPRAFSCRCGRPVFFGNSQCPVCRTPLGYEPSQRMLLPLEPAPERAGAAAPGRHKLWRDASDPESVVRYRRCANLDSEASCNWLVAERDAFAGDPPLCRCCRLTRTLPDLSEPDNPLWWGRIEAAKRRLVSSLIGLRLPVLSRMSEDPKRGLVFDLLRAELGAPPVVTGHADGVITLDVEEADDAWREQRRTALAEPCRTLLGHLRHDTGHYYWQRLVEGTHWHRPWRELFGDERQDYAAALAHHYRNGPVHGWGKRFVSAYASSHPWEDWAETWAHYLHLVDTLDTARSFGLDGERVELNDERFGAEVVANADDPQAEGFLRLINGWMELTGVLNELSRSMGMADFYPFVLSRPAVRKLYLVHRVIDEAGDR